MLGEATQASLIALDVIAAMTWNAIGVIRRLCVQGRRSFRALGNECPELARAFSRFTEPRERAWDFSTAIAENMIFCVGVVFQRQILSWSIRLHVLSSTNRMVAGCPAEQLLDSSCGYVSSQGGLLSRHDRSRGGSARVIA